MKNPKFYTECHSDDVSKVMTFQPMNINDVLYL